MYTVTDSARSYLDAEVFPYLLPALEQMLHKAQEWKCLEVQKCKFNGLDYLAEILWNRNPRYPERTLSWKYIFHIPFVKDWLADHPRPYYPLSWLLTENEAALIIQAAVRGFLVRCQPDVQEMRQFWKSLEAERKEEEQRKREEVQKWHQMLLEEKQQCKAEATAKLQQRQDKAAVKSQNEEMALKEQEEEFDEILMTIYDMTEDSMQD
ncbi:IQ domain-containing protein K-like [Periplaneta americana]|uniref:IQ domain-containing protein K-like n=1 Tax=Periplaneta americana TaxID=6978 RepID=UPI0037E9B074